MRDYDLRETLLARMQVLHVAAIVSWFRYEILHYCHHNQNIWKGDLIKHGKKNGTSRTFQQLSKKCENTTHLSSIHTPKFQHQMPCCEVQSSCMYHLSAWLPYLPEDLQQEENIRKYQIRTTFQAAEQLP